MYGNAIKKIAYRLYLVFAAFPAAVPKSILYTDLRRHGIFVVSLRIIDVHFRHGVAVDGNQAHGLIVGIQHKQKKGVRPSAIGISFSGSLTVNSHEEKSEDIFVIVIAIFPILICHLVFPAFFLRACCYRNRPHGHSRACRIAHRLLFQVIFP